jgi:hypothetical protein
MIERNPATTEGTPLRVRPPRPRTLLVGLLVVVVPLSLIGCKERTTTASETPVVESPFVAPSDSPTPTVAGTTIVTLAGKGNKTSDPFQASGDSVDVKYTYTCPAASSFTLNFYGTNGSPQLPDVVIDDFAAQGSDTITESLNGASGPFHFDVVTECEWSVTVMGTP